jgi:protein-disulfide isomerase
MSEPRNKRPRTIWPAAVMLIGLTLVAGFVARQPADKSIAKNSAAITTPASDADVKRYQVPVTASQASKGPADAIVTIVEWCDFQLPECKQVDPLLTSLLAEYPEQVRWVYRSFAQATAASQLSHEFARVAHEQAGKFWEAKQLLQDAPGSPTPDDFRRYAEQIGLDWAATNTALDKHTHSGHVVADRMFAQMFDVQEAPAFFVNGRRLAGLATRAAFKRLIDDEVTRATKLVASGVPKQQVYAELTKNGVWKQRSAQPN